MLWFIQPQGHEDMLRDTVTHIVYKSCKTTEEIQDNNVVLWGSESNQYSITC